MSSNMRIAVAGKNSHLTSKYIICTDTLLTYTGTSGLALLIAQEINNTTSHQLIILSRTVSAPKG
jgi:hypothetical protein